MVNSSNLACKNATGTTKSGTSVKWCSVTLSEVILQGKRLEASVFDVEAKQARDSIVHGRYPCVTLGGTEGLIDKAYYPGRFKRIYCEQGCGEARAGWGGPRIRHIWGSSVMSFHPRVICSLSLHILWCSGDLVSVSQ